MSFAKEIWDKFSKLDVSAHTEKRGQFTFLSWTWAWSTLMEHYPESYYSFSDAVEINDTLEMRVSIAVKDGDRELTRTMWLPVMDYSNKAVKHPGSRDVSDARMRCLVKCLAMFGLGHYIYAGQDLPVQPEKKTKTPASDVLAADPEQLAEIAQFIKDKKIPARTLSWFNAQESITAKQAENIINICKKEAA